MDVSAALERLATGCRVASRNLARNRARSSLALSAIACGVAALIVSGGFVEDLIVHLGEALIHSQSGHLQAAKRGYFEAGARSPGKFVIAAEHSEPARFADVTHVRAAARRLQFTALLGNGRSSYPILAEGVEVERDHTLGAGLTIREGRALVAKDRHAALVGEGLARAMDLKPGSIVNLLAPTLDESVNTVDMEVVGTFQSFSKDYDDRAVKLPLGAAQELLDTDGANVVVLFLDDTRHTAHVAQALRARFERSGLEVRTWDTLNDFYWKAVALYDRQFGVLRLIVLVSVTLAVLGAINMAVLERAGEFGTMRALGHRSAGVLRLVLLEAVFMGIVGATMGVALGLVSAWGISRVGISMPPPPSSNLAFTAAIRVEPWLVVVCFLIGLAATVLAAVTPALRVSRLPIVDALRRIA
jgi:putative ABC transport system permease protein